MSLRQLVLLGSFALSGCAVFPPPTFAPYPPTFEVVDPARLKEAMWRLAHDVNQIDTALRAPAGDETDVQRNVVANLDDMRDAAAGIKSAGASTNHANLDRNLPAFLVDITRARDAAAHTPPSYYLAGALTGSCLACHAGKPPP